MMKKYGKNSKFNKKKLVIYGSGIMILGGTIAFAALNNGNQKGADLSTSMSSDDNNSKKDNSDVNKNDNLNSKNETFESNNDETLEIVIEEEKEEKEDKVEIEPAVFYMTAEDVVKLSGVYADYLNKVGTFETTNYTYNKFEAKDLYSAIYLSNIDCFTNEETNRMIDMGIINDDIGSVIVNSFNFFTFYQNDTREKVRNNNKELIDLSMIFVNDDKAVKTFNTMNKVFNEMNADDKDKIASNFIDTYAYFAKGVELPVQNYDYSKSIYTSDRAELSIGAEYALSYVAEAIKDLSVEKGATTDYIGKTFSEIINDRSNIVRVFEGCVAEKENTNETSKVLTK